MSEYQYARIQTAARVRGAGGKAAQAKHGQRWSVEDFLAELLRLPGHCSHVAKPAAPVPMFGMDPSQLQAWGRQLCKASESVVQAKRNGKETNQRKDTPILMSVIMSYDDEAWDPVHTPKTPRFKAFWSRGMNFLAKEFGADRIAFAALHVDEGMLHGHVVIHLEGKSIKALHPGFRAEGHVLRGGGTKKAAARAKYAAMAAWLDRFHAEVGAPIGMKRKSETPRQRLPRPQYMAKQLRATIEADFAGERDRLEADRAAQDARKNAVAKREADMNTLELAMQRAVKAGNARREQELDEREREIERQESIAKAKMREAVDAYTVVIDIERVIAMTVRQRDALTALVRAVHREGVVGADRDLEALFAQWPNPKFAPMNTARR